jgi:hypothetical protein
MRHVGVRDQPERQVVINRDGIDGLTLAGRHPHQLETHLPVAQ